MMLKLWFYRVLRFYLILLMSLAALTPPSYADQQFRYPQYEEIYLNDFGDLLDQSGETIIRDYLQEIRSNTGIELTVLTIPSLSHYNAGPAIEPFATGLFNHWGIGNAERNDGVLVLVSASDRKMRIELGSGYTASWNQDMQRVIDDVFIPRFKKGDYQTGLIQGVEETIFMLTGNYPQAVGNSSFQQLKRKASGWLDKLGGWVLAIVVPIFIFIASGLRNLWRRRPRSCQNCQNPMHRLGESVDDQHLEGPQRLEEYLESVDYDVWQCAVCQRIDIYRYVSWFTGYETCPSCKYETLEADSTIVRQPTHHATGLKRIDYHCKNCDFQDTEMRTLPVIQESNSSGGSSSSFGGGSSSGGGASGSW